MTGSRSPARSTSKPPSASQVGGDRLVAPQVRETDAGADRGAVRRAGDLADRLTVAQHQLATPEHRVGVRDDERHQAPPGPGRPEALPAFGQRAPPQEVLVARQRRGEDQARLDRGVVGGELAPEGPEALLQPQRLDRRVAGVGEPELAPCSCSAS